MFHYLFPLDNRVGSGPGLSRVPLVADGQPNLSSGSSILDQDVRHQFRLGSGHRNRHGIRIRHELGRLFAIRGDVFGSALAAEGIFAFFLESGFLAVLLYGWNKVSRGFHFFATLMVALGSVFSAIWIVVANSWQQTPAGSHLVERQIHGRTFVRAEIVDFWRMFSTRHPSTG